MRIDSCVRPVTALALVAVCMAASGTPRPADSLAHGPAAPLTLAPVTAELPIPPAPPSPPTRVAPPRPMTGNAVLLAATRRTGGDGVPANVLAAYRAAEAMLAGSHPGCHLAWHHLAGIGIVESGHARGGQATPSGDTAPRILGPRLDGGPGIAAIADTDGGRLDGDTAWDRAVGPMQFIPSTWAAYGTDADGDGDADPHNLADAAAAAGHYLCSGGMDLADPADLRAAVFRYNNSLDYVATVMSWMHTYSGGATPVAPRPAGSSAEVLTAGEPAARPVQTPEPAPAPKPVPAVAPAKETPAEDAPAEEAPAEEAPAAEETPAELDVIELTLPCGALDHHLVGDLQDQVVITENCEPESTED